MSALQSNYNYNTASSREMIERILVILRANASGTTQREIAAAIHLTTATVSRYLTHMVNEELAYVVDASEHRNWPSTAILYKPGRRKVKRTAVPPKPKREYTDIPLVFFGVKK